MESPLFSRLMNQAVQRVTLTNVVFQKSLNILGLISISEPGENKPELIVKIQRFFHKETPYPVPAAPAFCQTADFQKHFRKVVSDMIKSEILNTIIYFYPMMTTLTVDVMISISQEKQPDIVVKVHQTLYGEPPKEVSETCKLKSRRKRKKIKKTDADIRELPCKPKSPKKQKSNKSDLHIGAAAFLCKPKSLMKCNSRPNANIPELHCVKMNYDSTNTNLTKPRKMKTAKRRLPTTAREMPIERADVISQMEQILLPSSSNNSTKQVQIIVQNTLPRKILLQNPSTIPEQAGRERPNFREVQPHDPSKNNLQPNKTATKDQITEDTEELCIDVEQELQDNVSKPQEDVSDFVVMNTEHTENKDQETVEQDSIIELQDDVNNLHTDVSDSDKVTSENTEDQGDQGPVKQDGVMEDDNSNGGDDANDENISEDYNRVVLKGDDFKVVCEDNYDSDNEDSQQKDTRLEVCASNEAESESQIETCDLTKSLGPSSDTGSRNKATPSSNHPVLSSSNTDHTSCEDHCDKNDDIIIPKVEFLNNQIMEACASARISQDSIDTVPNNVDAGASMDATITGTDASIEDTASNTDITADRQSITDEASNEIQSTENNVHGIECCDCLKIFDTNDEFLEHAPVCHSNRDPTSKSVKSKGVFYLAVDPDNPPVSCDICGEIFTDEQDLVNHQQRHSENQKRPKNQSEKVFCRYCLREFSATGLRGAHEQEIHKEEIKNQAFSYEKLLESKEIDPYVLNRTCRFCSKIFPRTSTRKRHEKIHEKMGRKLKEMCGEIFTDEQDLVNHHQKEKHSEKLKRQKIIKKQKRQKIIKKQSEKVFCRYCLKKFSDTDLRAAHEQQIHKEEIKNQAFSYEKLLESKETDPYALKRTCRFCSKIFPTTYSRKRHEKIHEKLGHKLNYSRLQEITSGPSTDT